MNRTKWLIIFFVVISVMVLSSNILIENNSLNNKQVMIMGTVIGLKSGTTIQSFKNAIDGKVQTSNDNIGIMTCIDLQTNKYVALCHGITVSHTPLEINNGKCYDANLISIEKSENNIIGSINAIPNNDIQYGNITQNTTHGIYGDITDTLEFQKNEDRIYPIASRTQIKKGKAEIYINLDGTELKSYEIEITGINYWKDNQNLNVKVTDEDLINITGGIIKGMSGTPIIQNGKFVGAINYASEKSSTEAYAIFADKLF